MPQIDGVTRPTALPTEVRPRWVTTNRKVGQVTLGMALDLGAIRAGAEREMSAEWLEAYGDASWAAALHALGEPVPAELEAKTAAQIKKAPPGSCFHP